MGCNWRRRRRESACSRHWTLIVSHTSDWWWIALGVVAGRVVGFLGNVYFLNYIVMEWLVEVCVVVVKGLVSLHHEPPNAGCDTGHKSWVYSYECFRENKMVGFRDGGALILRYQTIQCLKRRNAVLVTGLHALTFGPRYRMAVGVENPSTDKCMLRPIGELVGMLCTGQSVRRGSSVLPGCGKVNNV